MRSHKLKRNIFLVGGFLMLVFVLAPGGNTYNRGQILFLVQSLLLFIGAYFQHKEIHKSNNKERDK